MPPERFSPAVILFPVIENAVYDNFACVNDTNIKLAGWDAFDIYFVAESPIRQLQNDTDEDAKPAMEYFGCCDFAK